MAMETDRERIAEVYAAFNARDIEAVLKALDPQVDWPNGWEGGRVHGHDGVRDYWTRQWAAIDPHVEPVRTRTDDDGHVVVTVHTTVRSLAGDVIADHLIEHVYTFDNGLITRMDIREP